MTLLGLGLTHLSLLLLLMVISAMETAIHTVREVHAGTAVGSEKERALDRRMRKIRQNPFAQLQRTLLLSAALNLALATLGLYAVMGPLAALGWNRWLAGGALFGVTVLLGDVVPKFYAARRPSQVLLGGSRLLHPVRVVLDPLARLADRCAEFLIKQIVPDRMKARVVMTRDEFETLVEMREEQGLLAEQEGAMIREVLDLEALKAGDAMIPRVDVPLVSITDHEAEVEGVLEHAESRFVVLHGETPDVVEGVVDSRAWKVAGRPPWREVMQRPVFIAETMPMLHALADHLSTPSNAALVVDEYGGLEGLVSQEQIADWLLHEAAPWLGEDAEIRDVGEGRYLLDGGTRLDHIADELELFLMTEEAEGIDTIGGLVFQKLGRVPKAGERLKLRGADLKVRRLVKARIMEVELRLKPEQTGEPEEDER